MDGKSANHPAPVLKGVVYGDLVGAPFRIENTYNRYFDLGEDRRAYSHGRVRSFFPEATEVSHGAAAVAAWLNTYRDDPSAENLQRCLRRQYESHPRGGWTEQTRLFVTSGMTHPSGTPDWAAAVRAVPIASFFRDDLFRALELAEACVQATCTDRETARMARALTHAVHMAQDGSMAAEISTTMEMQYGLNLSRREEDIRAELRGDVAEQVVMMGVPVEGAYRWVSSPDSAPPSSRQVIEAALRAVVRSDSWEDAVRRAVSFGGPSNAVAGIAGGVAAALYGEVTPSIVGKLFTHIPMDIARQVEEMERGPAVRVDRGRTPYSGIGKDAVTLISAGAGGSVFVVPPERKDVRAFLRSSYPDIGIIPPSEKGSFLAGFMETRQGTFAYAPRPEVRTFYRQDGGRLVSPTRYAAPGMPPLQERRRHLEAFLSLRDWCVGRQKEMNALAGNDGAGQVHYGNAYHMWIGSRRIDFMMGDQLAGRISLDGRGLLKVDLGEYRDLSHDARFEGYREQAWASRSLFTIPQSTSPLDHLADIREAILSRLLDEGNGLDSAVGTDTRHLSDDDRLDRTPVSNVDRLETLPEDEGRGAPPLEGTAADIIPGSEVPPEGSRQAVRTIYDIGYGSRSREGLINTLEMLGVDTVVDVRSIPRSRYAPQFDGEAIYGALQEAGISLFLAGEKLGGRPEDPSMYGRDGRADWERIRQGGSYREGIGAILNLAAGGHVVAVAGAEGDPLASHRFGTVSRDLAEAGMEVRHILPGGEVVSHAEMEDRLLQRYAGKGLVPSVLTGSYREQICEAYRALNAERGFRHGVRARRGLKR